MPSRANASQQPPLLSLLDWKRRVHELYAAIRAEQDPRRAFQIWREQRDELFRGHPQSPLSDDARADFGGLEYFEYNEASRVEGTFEPSEGSSLEIPASTGPAFGAEKGGRVLFELHGTGCALDLFWITGYGGGAFLAFRDTTSGDTTYGGGRYLLDTIKGADLGTIGDRLVLDFNFAYNPSCSYDPGWACPLPPPGNRLDVEVAAGERLPAVGRELSSPALREGVAPPH